tara:strand:- start:150 stop:383 length:234 start_codon:yes stop_codon:yes gene_type:complete
MVDVDHLPSHLLLVELEVAVLQLPVLLPHQVHQELVEMVQQQILMDHLQLLLEVAVVVDVHHQVLVVEQAEVVMEED